MHTECFAKYEEIIVGYMSKAGRGRTWNDKQVTITCCTLTKSFSEII
jgi:hypothetical protein